MPKNYFVNIRQQIKIELLDFINKNTDKEIDKVLALFSFKTGYSVRILNVYLEELKEAGLVG